MYSKSKFAQHLLNEGHNFGLMEDITDIIQFAKKREDVRHPGEILHLQSDTQGHPNKRQINSTEESYIRNTSTTSYAQKAPPNIA